MRLLRILILCLILLSIATPVLAGDTNTVTITITPLVTGGITDFHIVYTSDTQIDLSWVLGPGTDNIMVRRQYGVYPADIPDSLTTPSDGELVYYGNASNFSDTVVDMTFTNPNNISNTSNEPFTVFYKAWGQNSDSSWQVNTKNIQQETKDMVVLTATLLFVGLSVLLSFTGYFKRVWWMSFIGGLFWLLVGLWWISSNVTTLYGIPAGDISTIVYYMPFFLCVVTWASIITYYNQVELRREGKGGLSFKEFGDRPKDVLPSNYEQYKEELQRKLGTTRR